MDIQLFSLAEHTPEGFKSVNAKEEVLPSATIVLYAETVEKALAFLRAYPAKPRGVIVTPGTSFDSSPASPHFWHLAIPKNNLSGIKNIAECFLDTFGCDGIPKIDSYKALQNRISELLMQVIESRNNETELKKIQTHANIGSWKWNLLAGKVMLSTELCRIYSTSQNKEYSDISEFFDIFTHPDDIKYVKKAIRSASKGHKSKALTFRIIRPDGEIRWIAAQKPEIIRTDDQNNPVEIIGIQQDITDQKKAEDELLQSELKLEIAARNIPGIIFQFYIRKTGEYGIDFVSGNLEKVFGIPEDTEDLFESFAQGIPSRRHRDDFYSSIDKAVTKVGSWNFETPYLKPSGEMIHVRGISKPTLLKDVLLFNGIMLDVTEQRNAIQRIEDLNSLLLAIRNVNQLIVQETELDDLLQKACKTLIETRSYQDCTIMLLDNDRTIGKIFQAGEKSYLKDELVSTPLPVCVVKAIDTGNYIVMREAGECEGCNFLGKHGDEFSPTFVATMKSEDRIIGILFVALSSETVIDEDEGALLQEVTDDIAFAMCKLDAEAKLIKSEKRYRKLFDSSHDAIMTLEPPLWRFTSGNPSILGMFGVSSEEEFTSMGPWDVSPEYQPDGQLSSDKAKKMIDIAMKKGSNFFEWTHCSVSGDNFPATVLLTRVTMQDNTFLQATVRDITKQNEMEEALRKSEARIRGIADSVPGVLFQAYVRPDGENGLYFISESITEILGMSSELNGLYNRFVERIPAESRKAFKKSVDEATRDVTEKEYITAFIKPSGDKIWIKIMSIPTKLEEEIVFNGVILDVTEQWEAEKALRAERDYSSSIIRGTPAIICGISPEGVTKYINPAGEKVTGYSSGEIVGQNWWKVFYPGEKYKQVEKLFRKFSEEGNVRDYEMILTTRTGEKRIISWNSINRLDENNKITEIIGFGFDVTDRKNTELELNQLRNYLANIIDSMPSVLIGVSNEGKITLWNSKAENRTGISAREAFGRGLSEVIPWLSNHYPLISESITSSEVMHKAKLNTSTGEESRYEDLTVYPLVADDVKGAVLRLDDITEQVRIEEMMIQSVKMLSVGGLAAGMAHEINNPLAGMMQNAEVILRRLTSDLPDNDRIAGEVGTTMEAIRSFLERRSILHQLELIHDSGRRAAAIVQNMLSFARKSETKPSLNNVAELLDKTLELAQNDYDLKKKYDFRHIKIKKEYEPSLPMILCERSKIQQVFLNILRNGTEAMWNSKSSTGKPKNPRFILRITAEDGFIVTEIEDNGPGIPEDIRKRIFEPFFTTKEVGVGTGLGLSVSYFIITEEHDGELEVESKPGRRTRFIIRLPIDSWSNVNEQ